jgi:hypothetical protein
MDRLNLMATHAGMTTAEFETVVNGWIATARHPTSKRPYTEMVYQPMLELLDYLRANDFKPSSYPAAASSSCARGPRKFTASHLSR